MNITYVLHSISLILRCMSTLLLVPCICAAALGEYSAAIPFIAASLISFCLGFLLRNKNKDNDDINNINRTEAFATVLLTWVVMCIVGTLPYFYFGLNPLDAFFESVSGITTTGATILTDFSLYPKTMFFWRSFSQWIGGLGIIVLFTAILPQFSIAGRQMFFAEVPGANENKKLTPRIRQTALALWSIYLGLTIIEICILLFFKMSIYDAICTSLSTVSGGGFSPNGSSIEGYMSYKFVWVVAVFMFFAGLNFALQYKVFIKRKISLLFKDEEFRFYVFIVILFTAITAYILKTDMLYNTSQSIRDAFFQVMTVISTTGFSSSDYSQWPLRAKMFLFVLMFTGASIGSASGGIKLIRYLIIFKYLKRQVTKIHHPNGVYPIKLNKVIISEDIVRQMISFVFFYYGIFCISAFILVLSEDNLVTGVSCAIATIGNIGPGFGVIGPMGNYGNLTILSKFICILNMFIGRLELIPFLALLHPDFWSVKKINNFQKNIKM